MSTRSLAAAYGDPFGAYTPSSADVRAYLARRSPLHYEDGDMRRDYDWTRAALAGLLAAGLVALACRLVLTGLFVTLVSAEPVLVIAFNASVTILVGGSLLLAGIHARRRVTVALCRRYPRRVGRRVGGPERL
jgi:hypothetical protein